MDRMRTIPKIIAEIKKIDPDTAITEHQIRTLVDNGIFKPRTAGSRVQLNLDAVLEYFTTEKKESQVQ